MLSKLKYLFFVGLGFLFSGCILLPYEEEPLCKIGKGGGYCGSISDVYEHTLGIEPVRRTPVKLKEGVPCENCNVDSYNAKLNSYKNKNTFQEDYEKEYFGR